MAKLLHISADQERAAVRAAVRASPLWPLLNNRCLFASLPGIGRGVQQVLFFEN